MREPLSDQILREYLLGAIDEPYKEIVEQAYLTDETENERLSLAEEELIEDYLDGILSPAERERFELFFLLSPQHQQSVAITSSLRKAGREERAETRLRWWSQSRPFHLPALAIPAIMGLVIVLTAASVVLYTQNARLHRGLRSMEQRPSTRSTATSPQLPVPQQRIPVTQAILLRPGLTREFAGTTPQVQVPAGAETVEFDLQIPAWDYSSYYAVLRTAGGSELWSQALLAQSGRAAEPTVRISVPASLLEAGDYQFFLSGERPIHRRTPLASYNFRVPKP
jgi:hypothetical protein